MTITEAKLMWPPDRWNAGGVRHRRLVRIAVAVAVAVVSAVAVGLPSGTAGAVAPNARFVWPATGKISQTAYQHKTGWENQYAVDITATTAVPVVAAADGWILAAGPDRKTGYCTDEGKQYPAGLGNVVTLQHDGGTTQYFTSYGHLASVSVTSGFVRKGQQIGVMGSTGCSTGRHVHFQVATCTGTSGVATVAGAGCSLWLGTDYPKDTPVTAGAEIPVNYPGLAGAQPDSVNPGWVSQGGAALDVAFATISGGWEMFHIGTNNVIYRRKAQNGVATGWTEISGPRAKKIAVATSSDGRVELFYIGLNNAIYHHWETTPGGDISRWESFGGNAREIAAARSGSTFEVFNIGTDGAIYRATQSNHAWQKLPGTFAYGIAAATSRDGRIELFHIAGGRNVMHAWQTAPGSAYTGPAGLNTWQDLGGVTYAIGASSVGNGEYEIYSVGGSNSLWRQAPWSRTHGWQRLAGAGTRIAAAKNPDGRVEVVHIGGTTPFHAWQKSVGWF